jgi:hypothetical protein
MIGASRIPTIHQVYEIYNCIFNYINSAQELLRQKTIRWKKEIFKALGKASEKLSQYYSDTMNSAAGELYGIAVLLDPRKKYSTWQQLEWRDTD